MLENYEIDFKMAAIWVLAITGVVISANTYYQEVDSESSELKIIISDESPEYGQEIEIQILEDDSLVEASILRINGEEYRQVSDFGYTIPEDQDEILIEAEYRDLSTERIIRIADSPETEDSAEIMPDPVEDIEEDIGSDEETIEDETDSPEDPGGSEVGEKDTDDSEDDTTEDVVEEEPENAITLFSPEDETTIELNENEEINFAFEITESSNYQLRINNNLYQTGEASTSEINITESLEPGSYEWFVRGVNNQEIFDSETREFEIVEQASINIDSQSTEVDDYILDLHFSVENAENYRILVNSETVNEDSTSFSEFYRHKFEAGGEQHVEIQALRSGEVVASETETFESEAPPEAQITWIRPDSPVDTTTPETEFEINTDVEYSFVYTINEDESSTEYNYWEGSGTSTESFAFTPDPLPEGEHEYKITVQDEHNTIIGETTGIFETTAERNFLEINDIGYNYYTDEGDENHLLDIDVEAYEDFSYEVELDGENISQDSFDGTSIQFSVDLGDLQSGEEYSIETLFESEISSQTLTETLSFTAQ